MHLSTEENPAAGIRAVPSHRVPVATYRLQFNSGFTLEAGRQAAAYLRELGVSDIYASPVFQAAPGSTHGYDVCGFAAINPGIGGEQAFEALGARLRELGMGLLLDMVPNHMGNDLSNEWWRDVLEKGPASPYARWFDIDWDSVVPGLKGKVLLPVLEDHYTRVLESGRIQLQLKDGKFTIRYYENDYPVAPESCQAVKSVMGSEASQLSTEALHELLKAQHYRLAWWRIGPEEINYRRFFDITQLVSLRMELPEVFEAAHRMLKGAIASGAVTGLRIDHPDGLWDPQEYFGRLQNLAEASGGRGLYVVVEKILCGEERLAPSWPVAGTTGYDFLNWLNGIFVDTRNAAEMTRVYERFIGRKTAYTDIVHRSKRRILDCSLVSELTVLTRRLERIAAHSRSGLDLSYRQLHTALAEIIAAFPVYRTYATSETEELPPDQAEFVHQAYRAARSRNPAADTLAYDFVRDLLLLRTPADLPEEGRAWCREFVMRFQQLTGPVMAKGLEDTTFYVYHRLISLNEVGGDPGQFGTSLGAFHGFNCRQAAQWPHTLLATATHDTKRGEDSRARLNLLSEIPLEWEKHALEWKQLNARHKQIVGGRAAPDANDEYLIYQTLLGCWEAACATGSGLAGFRERLQQYLAKALRESKRHTTWTEPNAAYEKAATEFLDAILSTSDDNPFLEKFQSFQAVLDFLGRINSLSQLLLKLTSPGVPDIYQGTEFWDFSLVDPDNRRAVNYEARSGTLIDLKNAWNSTGHPAEFARLLLHTDDARSKMFVLWQTLTFRKKHSSLFSVGSYHPLTVTGRKARHLCAFARVHGNERTVVLAPRLVAGLLQARTRLPLGPGIWADTRIVVPGDFGALKLRNAFTKQEWGPDKKGVLLASDVLADFPVALLHAPEEN